MSKKDIAKKNSAKKEAAKKVLWPESLSEIIKNQLSLLNYDINHLDKLVPSIIKQSNSYNSNTNANPWASKASQAAYLAYFFPLNTLRLMSVIAEADRLGFFNNIKTASELGSGCGTFDIAYSAIKKTPLIKTNTELSEEAIKIHKIILKNVPSIQSRFSDIAPTSDLFIASYALNETGFNLSLLKNYNNILILEPSTETHSRNLIKVREELIQQGYYAWAPCPHNLDCPILKNSKKDWCHDRVFIDKPTWFNKLENKLPNFNNSLTFSYLLLSKRPSPVAGKGLVRTIGNTLKEKGKHKQMICLNDERLFFSWLKKNGQPQFLNRGELFYAPIDSEKKSNEIRPTSEVIKYSSPD